MAPRSILLRAALAAGLAALLPSDAPAQASARGAEIFDLCVQCHGPAGEGNADAMAPAIAGLEAWYVTQQLENFRSGARGTHPDDLSGLRMYPMSLSLRADADLQAVAEHVASLPPADPEPTLEGGDLERGQQLYATCAACHGQNAAGNQQMNAPSLLHSNDWYLKTSIEKYKTGVRGSYPNAMLMRGMAAQLADDQAIRDVIAYIMTLPVPGE